MKGSFTGATADKPGLFQAADSGTLFLDEVAELPMHMQVKLLRAIQEKAVRPVGAQSEIPINVRFLSATQRDLSGLVAKSKFREDLYYRINVIELRVPNLRERVGDIPSLVEHFLRRLDEDGPHYVLTPDAYAALNAYAFPGNVRELENILQRAVALCDGVTIAAEDLGLNQFDRGTSHTGFVPGGEPLEGYLRDRLGLNWQKLSVQVTKPVDTQKYTVYRFAVMHSVH
jgi:two-component system response regulator PilR (NtrC family)